MNCNICTERFNKSNHSKVSCSVCLDITCSECTERYLLMTTENAHCMSCRAAWNREALESSGLSKKFITKDYKKRREDVLFERERGMMPGTQPLVEKQIVIRRLNKEVKDIEIEINKGQQKYQTDCNIPLQVIADEIMSESNLDCVMARLDKAYQTYLPYSMLGHEKNKKTAQIAALNYLNVDTKREARKFVRACPQNGCSGFLSTAWKCGVCENRACPDCHEPKEDEHVCKKECLETAQLLARDTKTCPKCAALIFKIEGCDQMWCTQCTTAFSWRTGHIEVGRIHNPHYYDYQRNAGRIQREIGDIPCGGMPMDTLLIRAARELAVKCTLEMQIIRYHLHIQHVLMPTWVPRWTDNQDLRIAFMLKDINEDIFKKKIQQREKENQKRGEISNIMNTYQVVTSEIMQRLVSARLPAEYNEICKEFECIRQYTNDLSAKVSKRYACVTPTITDNYSVFNMKHH